MVAKGTSKKKTSAEGKSAGSDAFAATPADRIYILHGKEDYLVREYTRKIEESLREAHGEFQRFDFDGSSTPLATVLDELRSYGMFQEHKMVIVNAADDFLSSKGDDDSKNRRAMEEYAKAPVEAATLVLRAPTWRPGNLDKYVKKVGQVMKCEPPTRGDTVKWCRLRVGKRYDAEMDADAAQALVELIGVELGRLDTELEKLATFVGSGNRITTKEVAQLVGMTREQQVWSIQDAILSGAPGHAYTHLRELMDISQVDSVPLMWSVIDLMRKVHGASALIRQGAGFGEISKTYRLWGPAAQRVMDVARALEPDEAAQLLRLAIETDRRSKSGTGDDVRSLEALSVLVADTMGRG